MYALVGQPFEDIVVVVIERVDVFAKVAAKMRPEMPAIGRGRRRDLVVICIDGSGMFVITANDMLHSVNGSHLQYRGEVLHDDVDEEATIPKRAPAFYYTGSFLFSALCSGRVWSYHALISSTYSMQSMLCTAVECST